jgi:hypothetical protein
MHALHHIGCIKLLSNNEGKKKMTHLLLYGATDPQLHGKQRAAGWWTHADGMAGP